MSKFTIRQTGPTVLEVTHGPWKLTIDIPVDSGGTATGPSPTDLLAISLAACKAITGILWAQRRGTPVSNIVAEVESEYAQNPTRVGKITTHLKNFKTQIDPAQHQRLERAIHACWVAATLENKPETITTIE